MNIADFFIQLGVKADTATLDKVNKSVKNLNTGLSNLTNVFVAGVRGIVELQAAVIGVSYAIDRFVEGTIRGAVSLQNLNIQTGLSIDKLQQWESAGQLSNLATSADQIGESIANLQRNLASISLGQGNISPFNLLGIDVIGKDAFQVLEQLRQRIKGLNPAVATNLISQMGLSPDFLNVLELSDKKFAQLANNKVFSAGGIQAANNLGVAIKTLSLRFQALKNAAVAKIAPDLERLIGVALKWLQQNGKDVSDAIKNIVYWLVQFGLVVVHGISLIDTFVRSITGLKKGLGVLAVAVAALALSFSPMNKALLFLLLILDDIYVWQHGGKSLFGGLYDGIAKFVRDVEPLFLKLKHTIEDIKNSILDATTKISTFFSVANKKDKSAGDDNDSGEKKQYSISDSLAEVWEAIKLGALLGGIGGSIVPGVGTVATAATVGFGAGALDALSQALKGIQNLIEQEKQNRGISPVQNTNSSSSNNNHVTNINIHSTADAKEVTRLVTREQQLANQRAQSALLNGGQ